LRRGALLNRRKSAEDCGKTRTPTSMNPSAIGLHVIQPNLPIGGNKYHSIAYIRFEKQIRAIYLRPFSGKKRCETLYDERTPKTNLIDTRCIRCINFRSHKKTATSGGFFIDALILEG